MGNKKDALALHADLVAQNEEKGRQVQDSLQYVRGADGQPISIEDSAAIRANIRNTQS